MEILPPYLANNRPLLRPFIARLLIPSPPFIRRQLARLERQDPGRNGLTETLLESTVAMVWEEEGTRGYAGIGRWEQR